MQSIKDTVTSTVKPVIDTAIQKGAPVLTQAIEGAISLAERIDPDARQREAVFNEGAVEGEEESKVDQQIPAGAAAQQ